MPQRKRFRRVHAPGDLHELTFSTFRNKPLLTNDRWRRYFCKALTVALPKCRCGLIAWVVMPDHVHLLVLPDRADDAGPDDAGDDEVCARLAALLAGTKRPVSARVKADLAASPNGAPLLRALTVRERPGKSAFRFWQEGAGYDRNLRTPAAVAGAIDYLHANPVRRGLARRPTDWPWSSARRFAAGGAPVDPRHPPLTRLPAEFWAA